jgi:molybdopterin-guanine dinucleotide biosynthesis protein A
VGDWAPLYGLVLAGGESRRFGRDKAAETFADAPQLERAFRLVEAVCDGAFVAARASRLDGLRERFPLLVDAEEGQGPLAGMVGAFRAHPEAAWLVVACDMPLLDEGTLVALRRGRLEGLEAVAYESGDGSGRPHPLCAVYEPTLAAGIVAAWSAGERSASACLARARLALLPYPGPALEDFDRADDVERLRGLVKRFRHQPPDC